MKVIAFTPIKLNNERLPGKNVRAFTNGQPLLTYLLRTLTQVPAVDEVYAYCSSDAIKDMLPQGVTYLQRDPRLDLPTALANDLLTTFGEKVDADIYIMAHVTAPFVSVQNISEGIEKVKSGEYDSALAVTRQQEFLWKDGKPFNYTLDSIPRTQDLTPLYVETTGFYIFTRDVLQNKKSRIGDRPYLIQVSRLEATDINNPEDFEIADAIFNHLRKTGGGTVSI